MNNPPRILEFDDVIELCGSVATSRGRVYKSKGAVTELDWLAEGNTLYSSVQGSAREPYQQRIVIAPHRLDGECSCPVGYNCKHVAAALLCWIDQQSATADGDDKKLRAVNRWVQRLVEQARQASPPLEQHVPGEPLLFYQLDDGSLTQHVSGIELKILQSRLLKRGGFGKESPYRYHSHYYHPDWVKPSDRAILDLVTGRLSDFSYRTLMIDGDIGNILMGKLLATGRCFWGEDREQPLQLGHSLSVDFDWLESGHELALDIRLDGLVDWVLVPADPPWYIDLESHRAGPMHDVPATGVLRELMAAPRLPRQHAQSITNYLASRVPDPRVPLPVPPNFVRVEEAPKPILVLQSRDESPDIRNFFASIRFGYGDYMLPFDGGDGDATLEGKTADGKPLVLRRDLHAEQQYVIDFGKRFPDFEPAHARDPDFFSRADRQPRAHEVQAIAQIWHRLLAEQDALTQAGWKVHCLKPFNLNFESINRIEASISETTSTWFDMAVKLTYNDQTFDLLPLVIDWLQSETREDSILLQASDGQWLEVPQELFVPVANTLLELFDSPDAGDVIRLPRQRAQTLDDLNEYWAGHGVNVAWQGAEDLFSLSERLQNFEGIQPPEMPTSLTARLRPYQIEGVAWLGFLAEYGFNGILADDMGLGKTLQTLTHLLLEFESGRLPHPALIVAPTSLLGNWSREAARFTPTLRTRIWHGSDRHNRGMRFDFDNIVITSYALVTRDIDQLRKQNFSCIVLDEAQAIKNPAAKVSRALKSLTQVPRRLCLTGTPLENHLGELWSQFDFLMPSFLGTRKHFNRHFRTPIENHGDRERQVRLNELIKPFLLRRRKEQVATELPPKTEIIREVTLEGAQAKLYESIRITMEQRVRQLLAERGLARSHIEMLDALLKLRQTCCHPALVKLDSARQIQESAKTELLMSMLVELIDEGKKILLFSQFTEMLGLIERELAAVNIPYVKLTGRTRKRDEVIDAFQHGDIPLFLISLKAGGTGLNLTAADTVIHYDPWWNPAVENQASDRAHRIGQTKPVFIYKLVASDTVEERIMAMQQQKQSLADQTINQDEDTAIRNLSADDILSLFAAREDEPID